MAMYSTNNMLQSRGNSLGHTPVDNELRGTALTAVSGIRVDRRPWLLRKHLQLYGLVVFVAQNDLLPGPSITQQAFPILEAIATAWTRRSAPSQGSISSNGRRSQKQPVLCE